MIRFRCALLIEQELAEWSFFWLVGESSAEVSSETSKSLASSESPLLAVATVENLL